MYIYIKMMKFVLVLNLIYNNSHSKLRRLQAHIETKKFFY